MRPTARTARPAPAAARLRGLSLAAAMVAVGAWGCGGSEGEGESSWSLPRVDLAAMETTPRERIEAAQEAVERSREAGGAAVQAAALGELGALYMAYQEFVASAECYRIAARLEPAAHRWRYLLALALLADGRDREAEAALEEALRRAPDDPPTLHRLARLRLERGDGAGAEAAWAAVLERDPASAAALQGLGRLAMERGELEAAAERFERALELQPAATTLHYQLGQIYRRLGRESRAAEHLARAGEGRVVFADPLARAASLDKVETAFEVVLEMAGDPQAVSDEALIGYAIAQFGGLAGAAGELEKVLRRREAGLGPDERARALYVVGALAARRQVWPAALALFEESLAADPDFAPARVQRASMMARLGRSTEALRALGELLEAEPRQAQALLRRAAILAELGRHQEAQADLDRLVALQPASSEARLRRARNHEALGRPAEAEREYRGALELAMSPADRALAHYRLALLAREGAAAALADYEAALDLDPTFHEARLGRAGLLARGGRLEEAAAEYRRVADGRPQLAGAWLGEASALILAGRHREAAERLEQARSALPEEPRIGLTLARHLAASPDRAVRDGARALELARWLTGRAPTPEAKETLAMALAEAGRHEEAAALQAELVAAAAEPRERARLAANLELYRRRQACCAAPGESRSTSGS